MKKLLLSGFLLTSLLGFASNEFPESTLPLIDGIELSEDWKEYTTLNGVKIEYRMKQCEGEKMRAQNLLLFKFTNTTNRSLTVSWFSKEFRNGECWNCDRLGNPEFAHTITLEAGEVLEGDGTSKDNKDVYVFGNFIKFVPGMLEQTLTNFEFAELSVR